jgi:hypothetical protein
MAIPLQEQYNTAVVQPDFRQRVSAASFQGCVVAYGLTPLSNVAQQAQRVGLINQIVRNINFATDAFSWIILTTSTHTAAAQITDTDIQNAVNANFDVVAQQLIAAP